MDIIDPIFDWLEKKFKLNIPTTMAFGMWESWDAFLRVKHPILMWIVSDLRMYCHLYNPYEFLRIAEWSYLLRNRFIHQTHKINTGLKASRDYSIGRKMLHGCFNQLVDYVEVRLSEVPYDSKRVSFNMQFKPSWFARKHFWFSRWRSREAGLAELDSRIQNVFMSYNSEAVENLKELRALYIWWKDIRPKRKCPYESPKHAQFDKSLDMIYGSYIRATRFRTYHQDDIDIRNKHYIEAEEMELGYFKEDREMLARLVTASLEEGDV